MKKKVDTKVVYTIEERETETNEYIGDFVYETLKQAKERFNHCKDYAKNSKCFKGNTLYLIKQVVLVDSDKFDTIIEEEFIDSCSF